MTYAEAIVSILQHPLEAIIAIAIGPGLCILLAWLTAYAILGRKP